MGAEPAPHRTQGQMRVWSTLWFQKYSAFRYRRSNESREADLDVRLQPASGLHVQMERMRVPLPLFQRAQRHDSLGRRENSIKQGQTPSPAWNRGFRAEA